MSDIYKKQGFGTRLDLKGKIALLIIDFVNGFADPEKFGGGNIPQAIQATVRVLEAARERGWPVAHSRIVFADDDSDLNVFGLKVPTLLALKQQSHESQIVDELAPLEGELVICKNEPSAFFNTQLASWLTKRGIQTVLLAGATTSGCIRASAVDAMSHGFRVFVLEDCVGDRALEPHQANLFDIQQKYGEVMPYNQFLSVLNKNENEEVRG